MKEDSTSCKKNSAQKKNSPFKCPKCGSSLVEFITYQTVRENYFVSYKDLFAAYMCGGWLKDLFGIGTYTQARTVRKCRKCGYVF